MSKKSDKMNDKDYGDNENNKNQTYEKNDWKSKHKNNNKYNNKCNDSFSVTKLILFYCPH